jgi:hypothetical protein
MTQKESKDSLEVVSVNIDSVKSIDISKGKIIELETTDSSLLYDIVYTDFLKNKIIVTTRDNAIIFDNNGKYLFTLGYKGNGPDEYVNFTNVFIRNEGIYLYDNTSKKILMYDENGNFIFSTKINADNEYSPSYLFPLNDGRFITKNTFQGDMAYTPIACILDEKLKEINTVEGNKIKTGLTTGDNFFQYDDEILYWETLCDTIFSIIDYKKMAPKYFVDFGKYSLPQTERIGKDVYDLIEYSNKPENANKIASFIRYINESDDFLRFMFIFQSKVYYCYYDKLKKTTQTYCFEDVKKEFKPAPFVYYHDGYVYLSVFSESDFEKNPYLVVFDEKDF